MPTTRSAPAERFRWSSCTPSGGEGSRTTPLDVRLSFKVHMFIQEKKMSRFTPEEITYLNSQRLGRLATTNENGDLHVVPVGFRYNPETDTIDIGGHNFAASKKYREAIRHGRVAFVVDDVLPPWRPRFIEVRGTVEAVPEGGKEIVKDFVPDILRITPTYIVSIGINDDIVHPSQGRVR